MLFVPNISTCNFNCQQQLSVQQPNLICMITLQMKIMTATNLHEKTLNLNRILYMYTRYHSYHWLLSVQLFCTCTLDITLTIDYLVYSLCMYTRYKSYHWLLSVQFSRDSCIFSVKSIFHRHHIQHLADELGFTSANSSRWNRCHIAITSDFPSFMLIYLYLQLGG